ncbi:MAG: MerR family transcriptional regulator [Acidobacteria bacterium]|nr:MerR family transcriptional regulator [Acidobacteriota bacterium]
MPGSGPYKMRTISRMTELSPALLRAWERRHGLLQPLRGSGGHRMYTDEDLQILLRVRELIRQGRSIGEIAVVGREALLRQSDGRAPERPGGSPPKPEKLGPRTLGELRAHSEEIVAAALELDQRRIDRALDEAFALVSPEAVIFEVIEPATRAIGDLWAAGKCSVASEHVATGAFVHRLLKLVESASPARAERRPVIVSCFPDEYHQLGALIVAYRLSRHGLRVSYMGAALPFDDLESACDLLHPSAVLLSATRPALFQIHRKALAETARRTARKALFYVGGQGAPQSDALLAQSGVRFAPHADSHREALDLLAAVLCETAVRI